MFKNFLPEDSINLKIGLLGGSFNPPHTGHLAITLAAIKKLNLHRVFWLVTPCSPAKKIENYLNLNQRLKLCQELVQKQTNLIKVLDWEKNFVTNKYYSINTINRIRTSYPQTRFFWIIGGDNFLSFSSWRHWQSILNQMTLVVCERGFTAFLATHSKVAKNIPLLEKEEFSHQKGYFLLHQPRISISSSEIREKFGTIKEKWI